MAQDHNFLDADSYVDYAFADVKSADDIDRDINNDRAKLKDPIPPDLLEIIRAGVLSSPHTKKRVKAWYQEYLLDTALGNAR